MKASEFIYVKEAKVEMCSEACCGKPITECKCGPDCKHCDCYEKNKVSESGLQRSFGIKKYGKKGFEELQKAGRDGGGEEAKGKIKDKILGKKNEGKSPHKKGTAKYKKHMAAMHAEAVTNEDAKEKFEPHMMYDPKTGKGKHAKVEKDHLDMKAKGWSHDKPKVKEDATAGATSVEAIASVSSVVGANRKVSKKGKYGAPKAPQATNADGTAKNALDMKTNVMGGKTIKR